MWMVLDCKIIQGKVADCRQIVMMLENKFNLHLTRFHQWTDPNVLNVMKSFLTELYKNDAIIMPDPSTSTVIEKFK